MPHVQLIACCCRPRLQLGLLVRRCGQCETLVSVWLLMFQLQQLGSRPQQPRGWQRETAVFVRTWSRYRHALLHLARHPHGGGSLLGAGSRCVPLLGGSTGGRQAHAAAGHAPGIPVELHLHGPGRPTDPYRGRADVLMAHYVVFIFLIFSKCLTDKQTPIYSAVSQGRLSYSSPFFLQFPVGGASSSSVYKWA